MLFVVFLYKRNVCFTNLLVVLFCCWKIDWENSFIMSYLFDFKVSKNWAMYITVVFVFKYFLKKISLHLLSVLIMLTALCGSYVIKTVWLYVPLIFQRKKGFIITFSELCTLKIGTFVVMYAEKLFVFKLKVHCWAKKKRTESTLLSKKKKTESTLWRTIVICRIWHWVFEKETLWIIYNFISSYIFIKILILWGIIYAFCFSSL